MRQMKRIARPRGRALAWLAAMATAAFTTAACGHPFTPADYSPTSPYATVRPWSPPPAQAPVPRGPMTVGVDLYDTHDHSVAQTRALGKSAIAYIANTLRVKSIGISWDYTVPGWNSDRVLPASPVTPTIDDIAALTSIARSYGLHVEYRVLFAITGVNGQSERLKPASTKAWLDSLLATEAPALRLAQSQHVGEFIVGTEMAAIEGSPLWRGFFTQAAKLYHGTLSYATWGGSPQAGGFFSSQRALPPVGLYGVTAYPSVSLPSDASVSRLTGAWQSFLKTVPEPVLRRTAIDEIGIPAVDGAYADPWEWNHVAGQPDDEVQARWFQAACAAAEREHVRAIYFWNVNLSDNPANGVFSSAERFEGRPASEAAIRACVESAGSSR
jgi:glycosyl hydrolase family 113